MKWHETSKHEDKDEKACASDDSCKTCKSSKECGEKYAARYLGDLLTDKGRVVFADYVKHINSAPRSKNVERMMLVLEAEKDAKKMAYTLADLCGWVYSNIPVIMMQQSLNPIPDFTSKKGFDHTKPQVPESLGMTKEEWDEGFEYIEVLGKKYGNKGLGRSEIAAMFEEILTMKIDSEVLRAGICDFFIDVTIKQIMSNPEQMLKSMMEKLKGSAGGAGRIADLKKMIEGRGKKPDVLDKTKPKTFGQFGSDFMTNLNKEDDEEDD